jgi:CDP-2,3-bis-(O-geranylgeranyl)-sn-glycerol synthase
LGVAAGTGIGALETFLYPALNAYANPLGFSLPPMSLFVGFMIALGSMVGDSAGSFVKRRLGMQSGADAPFMDQLNFIVGAIIFSFAFTRITAWMIFFMVIVTPAIHRVACIIGYRLGLKKVPW